MNKIANNLLALLIFPIGVSAADLELDTPILTYGEFEVTLADYVAFVDNIPVELQLGFRASQQRAQKVLEGLLQNKILAAQMLADTRSGSAEFELRRQHNADKYLADAWIEMKRREKGSSNFESLAREDYMLNKDKYLSQAKWEVSHILVSSREIGETEARKKVESLAAQLEAKPDRFTELALQESDDMGTSNSGGFVGEVSVRGMDPAFVSAAQELRERGQISKPVRSKFGYHLIKLEKFSPVKQLAFEEVKAQLIKGIEQAAIDKYVQGEFRKHYIPGDTVVNDALYDQLIIRYDQTVDPLAEFFSADE